MKIDLNMVLRELLFLLIIVYFLQGSLYSSGSIIGKISLLFILIISSYYLFNLFLIKKSKDLFFYTWTLFLLLNFLFFIFEWDFGGIYYSQFRNILTAILPFYPIYYLALKNKIKTDDLVRFFLILLPVSIANFYVSRNNLLSDSLYGDENVVSNTAYFFASLIPFIFFIIKRKYISVIFLLIIIFFIIQGAKRGALIVGLSSALVFVVYQIYIMDPKEKIKNFIFFFLGLSTLFFVSYYFYSTNEFLVNRITDMTQNSSNRDIIYENLWKNWHESDNLINILFGFGFVSSILYSGNGFLAHNDWLEILTNFGLIGVFIYFLVIMSLFSFLFFKKVDVKIKIILFCILLAWILKTLFSMYYTVSATMISSMLIGYLLGTKALKGK